MTDPMTPPNSEAVAAPAQAQSWLDGMPDDLRAHLGAKGWDKAPDAQTALIEVAKSQRAAEQRLGVPAERLLRLPDQMTGEWWAKNAGALGIPGAPEGYEIERPALPEGLPWDESFEAEARKAFHAAGAPPHVVNAAVKFYAERTKAAFEADQAALHGAREKLMGELKSEWGSNLDANIAAAQRAFQHFAGSSGAQGAAAEGLAARLSQAMGGDAPMLRMFHAIGSAMGEDNLRGGGAGSGGGVLGTAADIEAEIKSLRESKEYQTNPRAFTARLDPLYKALVVAQGRERQAG